MAKIKNAIIIDGVTYELVKEETEQMCDDCDLQKQCSGIEPLCLNYNLPNIEKYLFKKVNADCEHASDNTDNKS